MEKNAFDFDFCKRVIYICKIILNYTKSQSTIVKGTIKVKKSVSSSLPANSFYNISQSSRD